jgi:hypothetical protein
LLVCPLHGPRHEPFLLAVIPKGIDNTDKVRGIVVEAQNTGENAQDNITVKKSVEN